MTNRKLAAALALSAILTTACSSDSSGPVGPGPSGNGAATINADITTNRTLYADTVYTLSGFIHVANGATLTIQPGTKIVGDPNVLGSSLFILRGARIIANGTASKPIVFTSARPEGQRQPGDWGGLIIVGNGVINRSGEIIVEGSNTGTSNNYKVTYSGGNNNADNSGSLSYVRVEFAGFAPAQDQELNSFTFAAVGSGTQLDHLEALSGLDDSYEFFGGAVDGKYLISYESGDDHFDMSEGYSGRLQFIIGLQTKVLTPRSGAGSISSDPEGIENDGCNGTGCDLGHASAPFTTPFVANFTLIGRGDASTISSGGDIGMMLRRGTGGHYINGVVARWARAAMSVRDQGTQDRVTAGDLNLNNILVAEAPVLYQTGTNQFASVDATQANLVMSTSTAASLYTTLPTPNTTSAAQIDWTPAPNSPARTGGMTTFAGKPAQAAGWFIVPTSYRGAIDPNGAKWWEGWTYYAQN